MKSGALPRSRPHAVISGVGVVSPIGIGRHDFWSALKNGTAGVRPVSIFDTAGLPCHDACEIADFSPETLLGKKGLKYLDRSTQLAACATALAFEDAGFAPASNGRSGVGLVLGTMFGSVESVSAFDCQILQEGPRSVNPMGFPRTVINSPAGHVAIRFGLTGLNTTISAGTVSSLQAIAYAADFIADERADVLLAGGVEELGAMSYSGFCAAQLLAGSDGTGSRPAAPLDVDRSGFSVGEGAVVFVVESLEHASRRGATVLAEISGFGTTHLAPSPDTDRQSAAAAQAMRAALADACVDRASVGAVCAGANGGRIGDQVEARAIAAVFGTAAATLPVYSIKSMVGETLGAAGAFQVAASLLTLREQVAPATVNFREADPLWGLAGITRQAVTTMAEVTIANSFGPDGINASLVLRRPAGPWTESPGS